MTTENQPLKLTRPLVIFDIETTGLSVQSDRIIQIAALRIEPNGVTSTINSFLNPQRNSEPAAIAVHGIKDEFLKDKPTFADLAEALYAFFEGCDLAGFNIEKFDLPMLSAEFDRIGYKDFAKDRKIIDAMTIYHKNERRDLPSAVRFYLDKEHVDAHDALADVKVTAEIITQQVARYKLPDNIDGLHDYCHEKPKDWVDADGKFIWRGEMAAIGFGKHLGRTLQDMSQNEAGYLQWILKGQFSESTKLIAHNALEGIFPKREL